VEKSPNISKTGLISPKTMSIGFYPVNGGDISHATSTFSSRLILLCAVWVLLKRDLSVGKASQVFEFLNCNSGVT